MNLRALIPKLPHPHDAVWVDCHIPTMVYTWVGKMVVFLALGAGVFSIIFGDVQMITESIEYIPADYVIPVAISIAITAVLMYAVFYLMSFADKKSEVLKAQAEAINKGEPVDELALARVKNFHKIYVIAMVLGIAITSVIAFAIFAVFVGKFIEFTTMKAICYAVATEIVVYLVFDRFAGRPIADGTFKKRVVDPAEQAIVDQFLAASAPADEEEVKEEKDPTQLLVEQLVAVLNQGKKR